MTDVVFYIFSVLLNMSITAGWIILVLLALRLIFRRAPKRLLCDLWGLAALRLLIPVSFQSKFSFVPSTQTVAINGILEPYSINLGFDSINDAVDAILENTDEFSYDIYYWIDRLSFTWLIGMCVLLLLALVSYIQIRRSVRESVPVRDRIYLCDGLSSPFVFGLFRPKIYIPAGTGDNELKYVEAHEKAHIRRLDHIRKLFAYLLLCVYWFHPLVWIAYILFCRDVEGACDEYVINKYDDAQRADYSEALLRFSSPSKNIRACPVAFGEIGVKARIRKILYYKKPARALIAVVLASAALLGFVFLSDPVNAKSVLGTLNAKYVLLNMDSGTINAELTFHGISGRGKLVVFAHDGAKTIYGKMITDTNAISNIFTASKTGETYVFPSIFDSYRFSASMSTGELFGVLFDGCEFFSVQGELYADIDGRPGKERLLMTMNNQRQRFLSVFLNDGTIIFRELQVPSTETGVWLDCDRSGQARLLVKASFYTNFIHDHDAAAKRYPLRLTDGEPEAIGTDPDNTETYVSFSEPIYTMTTMP